MVAGHLRQPPKGQGEVGALLLQQVQEVLHQFPVPGPRLRQPQLGAEFRQPGPVEMHAELLQHLLGGVHCLALRIAQQRQERLGQAGKVPLGYARLVAVGVAALVVYGTIDSLRMIGVHEGAGAIVNGLAAEQHVVGVHHPVDEAERLPLRHQPRLGLADAIQQRQGRHGRRLGLRIVAGNDMLHQRFQRRAVAAGGGILHSADADMALRHPRQDSAGQRRLPIDGFAGGDRRQRPAGRHAQGMHGLAHRIFTQHGAKGRPAIAHAGIKSGPAAFQLQVVALAVGANELAQEHSPAIAQLGVVAAELMPGIGLGDGLGAAGHMVAGQHGQALRRFQPGRVQPQEPRQPVVHPHQPRLRHRRRRLAGIEARRQARIAVVKGEVHPAKHIESRHQTGGGPRSPGSQRCGR